ncbi:MAG TPA: Rieske 2Fe-2S domain-containing protein [Longimicrobiales bacterium]|jgi:nitrite reductase/ring-hydroxylating ferredoxin subunit
MADYQPVLRTPELGPGEMREVHARETTLLLANVGQTYYALDARCPEHGTNLAREGRLEGYLLVCPIDGAAYDLRTGAQAGSPDGPRLRRYAIRVEENQIKVGPPLEG